MTADPFPDGEAPEGVRRLFTEWAMAMAAGDPDAVLDHVAFPHAVSSAGHTSFFEDEESARDAYGRAIADWRAHGVVNAVATVRGFQPLPDEAGRANVMWRLTGQDGSERLAFDANYTLIADEDAWRVIGVDLTREADARSTYGWNARAPGREAAGTTGN